MFVPSSKSFVLGKHYHLRGRREQCRFEIQAVINAFTRNVYIHIVHVETHS